MTATIPAAIIRTDRRFGYTKATQMPMHDYVSSGLTGILIADGYETGDDGSLTIHDVEGLHRAIGRWLADLPRPLSGPEMRFLRTEMQLTPDVFGMLVGLDADAIRGTESRIIGFVQGLDRLVRLLYLEHCGDHVDVAKVLLNMARNVSNVPAQALFSRVSGDWKSVVHH